MVIQPHSHPAIKIDSIKSAIILNSQGHKAVECTVVLDNGRRGTFAPPEGTSTGKYEAKAVEAEVAVEQIKKITSKLKKFSITDQRALDEYIKKQDLGANATLAISVAYAVAAGTLADKRIRTLPKLMVLFFEGGVHSSSNVKVQEYMGVYRDIFEAAQDYLKLRKKLLDAGHFVNCGMEGGMVSEKLDDEQILSLMEGKKIAIDMGGSYLSEDKSLNLENLKTESFYSIEDPFPEDAIEKWRKFYKKYHKKILIVGDDLTVTNSDRIKKFANNAVNAVIIKPNQQYTLTDTLEAIKKAREYGLKIIISHRSGETNQTFIADLAVAVQADYVKFGGPIRGERVIKYNQLFRRKGWPRI